jgi:hypothetical protein
MHRRIFDHRILSGTVSGVAMDHDADLCGDAGEVFLVMTPKLTDACLKYKEAFGIRPNYDRMVTEAFLAGAAAMAEILGDALGATATAIAVYLKEKEKPDI